MMFISFCSLFSWFDQNSSIFFQVFLFCFHCYISVLWPTMCTTAVSKLFCLVMSLVSFFIYSLTFAQGNSTATIFWNSLPVLKKPRQGDLKLAFKLRSSASVSPMGLDASTTTTSLSSYLYFKCVSKTSPAVSSWPCTLFY